MKSKRQIGDVVTDKNGDKVRVIPEKVTCDGCFYDYTSCNAVRDSEGKVGCSAGGYKFEAF